MKRRVARQAIGTYLGLHHEDAVHPHLMDDPEHVHVAVLLHVLEKTIHGDEGPGATHAGATGATKTFRKHLEHSTTNR